MKMAKTIIWIIIVIAIIIVGGIFLFSSSPATNDNSGDSNDKINDNNAIGNPNDNTDNGDNNNPANDNPDDNPNDWRNTVFVDVATGEEFKISDFKGKPILLESFAVWCPTCTEQQKQIKALHEEVGDQVISISLDTDPNEDFEKVREHIERNGFNWYYAVSPATTTQSLIDEFGLRVVNAPSAPIVFIDENLDAKLLERGVKSAEKLKSIIGA
jgi:cytochrome oxidase Cu insertion factor (SCO1/SenC/PrrC family)